MKSIGKYQVIDQIGASPAGTTYRVRDSFRNREFALKILQTVPGLTSAAKEQFCGYLASCAELVHRHLVKVQDMGEVEEGIFVVSEWRTGMDLTRFMQENPDLPLGQKLALAAQVAEGLAFAHSREVPHGDLKPSNVFVDGARDIKILDFGIAKWLAALLEAGSRPEGLTVNYLAPEQVLGEPFDGRSDIFALGLILYQFISGEYPFSAAAGLIPREIVHTEVKPLRLLDPQIPEQLDLLVQRALLKDPTQRLQTAEEFAAGLYLAAQELRRQASAAAPAAPPNARPPDIQKPVERPAQETTAPPDPPAAVIQEAPPRAAEKPRERPQDAAGPRQPWTARSYAAGTRLSKDTPAPRQQEPRAEPPPESTPASIPAPPAPAASAPVVETPLWAPPPPVNPVAPVPRPLAKPPLKTTPPLITKRTVALVAGLVLAAVIVGSFVSRKSLQASQNKKSVPTIAAHPPALTTAPKPPAAEPEEPAAAKPSESGPDNVGTPEFLAKETLRGPVRSLWESGRYAEALALVNRVLANNPNNAEARAWKKKVRDAQEAEAALK
jgi:serine/threonine-protein kinase